MRITKLGVACTVALIATLFSGCATANTPDDLAFVSVQAVDWYDQDEMPGPAASPVLGMVNSSDLERSGQSLTGTVKPHRLLLKIEFTSATNLSQFAMEHLYNLGNTAFLCNRPDDRLTISFSYVFWRGVRLGLQEIDPIQRQDELSSGRITYYIFVNVADKERLQDKPPQAAFDLRRSPENICFYLRGGSESGLGYKSNVVLVPEDAIATALTRASMGSGG
ncbi:hypothetical protein [Tistlia consotensis]|uniref:hypothetical protein n=1 Tax=Tistlia consotensis TaxID=1321365 RepID=UPI00117EC142|nr:hypothetical protein [Tistlia consotensis]